MRFRFCGDLDCPDWVLAEINLLAKMTSVKMKLLCVQVAKDLLGDGIDYDKVYKVTADAKFEPGDVKASIAVLTFVLSSAAKYNVDGETLSSELQQLGLPKEHAGSLCKTYEDNMGKLQAKFHQTSLRLPSLGQVQWRVDYVLASSHLKEVCEPSVQLRVETKDGTQSKTSSFTVPADKFRLLLSELKQAESMMKSLTS